MSNVVQGSLKLDQNWKIGIVTSRFNNPVTELLEKGAVEKFLELGGAQENLVQVRVPGALEIPVAAKWLLEQGCEGVCAVGAVIRGETTHYDSVCEGVERGCGQLQLEFSRPVGNGVITTENGEQAYARAGGEKGNKGSEAMSVVIEMLNLKDNLSKH